MNDFPTIWHLHELDEPCIVGVRAVEGPEYARVLVLHSDGEMVLGGKVEKVQYGFDFWGGIFCGGGVGIIIFIFIFSFRLLIGLEFGAQVPINVATLEPLATGFSLE